jgi:hypothetical protein
MEMDSNLGKNGILWSVFGGEMVTVGFELRYMVILSVILILSDFWWGHSDTMKRYHIAEKAGDTVGMEKYKWHKSRAIRRTAAKLVDYVTYMLVGAFFGLAIIEPMGGWSHVITAAIGLGVGCLAEIASIIGHFCYIKFDVEIKIVDVWKWLLRFVVNIFRIKGKEIGDALDQTINNKKEE